MATKLGLTPQRLSVATPGEIEQAFAAFGRERPDAVLVLGSHPVIVHRALVVDLAARHRVPVVY